MQQEIQLTLTTVIVFRLGLELIRYGIPIAAHVGALCLCFAIAVKMAPPPNESSFAY
jgi:hypothetical protein